MKKIALLMFIMIAMLATQPTQASAQTILFVPADNRPVSLEYVVDTARAAKIEVITPPSNLLGNNTAMGNPDALWDWVFSHAQDADAIVLSGDTMLYGSLVSSRTHDFTDDTLQQRMDNFAKLKQSKPFAPVYVFATIMRTPQFSAGGVEPADYEKYGPDIFQITALEDKRDLEPLTQSETVQLQQLINTVPQEAMSAWMARRNKNFNMDTRLIDYAKNGTFEYLILGRDDCFPFSQSHKESRLLSKVAQGLTAEKYLSFPGADQLGMLLVTRAINDINWQIPFVKVMYAPGAGPKTLPTYEDKELGQTIPLQITAAGGVMLNHAINPDLILAVNTPKSGKTLEASNPTNQGQKHPECIEFAKQIATELTNGKKVAVGNVAFSNGADNCFMYELNNRHLLSKLATISGWNTASNTLGYTIGQGMLSSKMSLADKNNLIAVRLLDDWAYQANVRTKIIDKVIIPAGGNVFYLNNLLPMVTTETQREIQSFAATNLQDFDIHNLELSYPWNRMFEIDVKVNMPSKN